MKPNGHVVGELQVTEDVEPPPDGGYGWVVVLASFLCNMVSVGYQQAYGLFIGDFSRSGRLRSSFSQ